MAHNPAFDDERAADDLAALHDALAEKFPTVIMVSADPDAEPSTLQAHLTRPGRRGADWHHPADRTPGGDR